jgi:hypothetical protein
MKTITLEHLQEVREHYRQSEIRSREMAAADTDPIFKKAYLELEIKTRGMKEGIEGLIFDLTGVFPTD